MLEENKNNGVILAEPSITDWKVGEETGIVYEVRDGIDNEQYLPTKENQYLGKFDTFACVSFSANNSGEHQADYLIAKGLIPVEHVKLLADNGYFDENGKLNLSDRFLAKMSGTTHDGNSLGKVAETLRTCGGIPQKDWDFDCNTWDEFYKEIPQNLKDKAKILLEVFDIRYEWVIIQGWNQNVVDVLKAHTKQCPIQIAAPVCPMWSRYKLKQGDVIASCPSVSPQHATIIYKVDSHLEDFDHYEPHKKPLANDYPIPYGLKILFTPKKAKTVETFKHTFTKVLRYGQHDSETVFLQKALILQGFLKLDNPTDYYGEQTRRAVKAFQMKYQIASDKELQAVNGMNVGPKTIAQLNKIYSK